MCDSFSLAVGFFAFDAALFGEEGHGAHEVLHADDADDASALSDGDEGEAAAGGEAADGGAEGVFGAGDLEGAGHDGLDVAVAVVAEGVDDALAGDDADEFGTADDGEVLLQGVDAAIERVGEGVTGREGGEVSEHDFAHAHGVNDGLEEDALVFDLRADHDEEAGDDEPGAVQEHAGEHGGEGEELAESAGGAAGGGDAVGAGEVAAEQASGIEGIRGQQMEDAKAGLHPDHAAEEVGGGDPGLIEEADVAAGAHKADAERERREEVGEGSGEGDGELAGAAIGVFLAFRVGVGEEAADGEQEDGAEAEAEPGGDEEAGGFADDDGGNEDEEEGKAASYAVGGAEAQAHEGEQREECVHPQFNTEPTTQRDGPAAHRGIVEGRPGTTKMNRAAEEAGTARASGILLCDARDCGEISQPGAGGAGGDGDTADERPAAGDAV